MSTTRILVYGGIVLLLSACEAFQTGDPWLGQDPQWKRTHFESYSPDDQLRDRAAYYQIDR